jgi:hypothetical protein
MALSVYPEAKIEDQARGILLYPSPAPVAPKTLRLVTGAVKPKRLPAL